MPRGMDKKKADKERKKRIVDIVKKGPGVNLKRISGYTLEAVANQHPNSDVRDQARLELKRRTSRPNNPSEEPDKKLHKAMKQYAQESQKRLKKDKSY